MVKKTPRCAFLPPAQELSHGGEIKDTLFHLYSLFSPGAISGRSEKKDILFYLFLGGHSTHWIPNNMQKQTPERDTYIMFPNNITVEERYKEHSYMLPR